MPTTKTNGWSKRGGRNKKKSKKKMMRNMSYEQKCKHYGFKACAFTREVLAGGYDFSGRDTGINERTLK